MNFKFLTSALGIKYYSAASRLINYVEDNLTDDVTCLTENNYTAIIPDQYKRVLRKYNIEFKKNFIWKPWFILSILKTMEDNAILFYLDAGCELSNGSTPEIKRLLNKVAKDGSQYFTNGLLVKDWCDDEVLYYVENRLKTNLENDYSCAAGVLILRNDKETKKIIKQWCYCSLYKNGYLFNGNNNINHRHDQFVLSLLLKINEIKLSNYPIWFPDWSYSIETTFNYPIHTLRNTSKISLLKIFNSISVRILFKVVRKNYALLNLALKTLRRIVNIFDKIIYTELNPLIYTTKISIKHKNTLNYFVTAGDTRIFNNEINYQSYRIKNAYLYPDGAIKDQGAWIIKHSQQFGRPRARRINKFILKSNVIDDAIICLNRNSNNLYHFIYDCLIPIISESENHREKLVLIDNSLVEVKKYLLGKLGFHLIKIIESNERCMVKNLVIPQYGYYSGCPNCSNIQKLKSQFPKIEKTQKILINRKNKYGRSILFSKYQYDRLIDQGFKEYFLDELKPDEQINLFLGARIIIAPHGAELSWTFLCDSDVTIYELNNSNYRNDCFARVSASTGALHKSFFLDSKYNMQRPTNPNIIFSDSCLSIIINEAK